MKKILVTVFLLGALMLGGCYPAPGTYTPTPTEEDDMPGLSPLVLEFENSTTDAINYSVLPLVYSDEVTQITITVWGYLSGSGQLVNFSGNSGGVRFSIAGVGTEVPYLRIYTNVFNSAPGQWHTDVFSSVLGGWHLFAVTYDITSPSNDPIFYIDGTAVSASEILTPAGTAYSRDANQLIIGNRLSNTENYDNPIAGKLFDVRAYNVILTASQMTAIYNSGTPSMTAGTRDYSQSAGGLVFQGFTVRTESLANYVDQELTAANGLKVMDAQFKAVGSAVGSVTGRAAP